MTAFPAIGLLLGMGLGAAELPPPVERAFANMSHDLACDYTRTANNGEEVLLERFEERGGRWTLLTVDGEPPSKRRLKRYAGQTEQRAERQHPAAVDFARLAEPGSYRLLTEDADRAVYEFKPLAEDEDDEDIVASLTGKLTIDKDGFRVASFEVTNFEPLSPAAAVTIHEMRQSVDFASLGTDGTMVSRRIETRTEGRLLGFKKISDHRIVTFDDFDCR